MSKKILMIAGANGAGKTTMTLELLRSSSILYEFINADEIARGLSPIHPESVALTASKLMLQRLKELLHRNQSFAFETTASGTNYIHHLKSARGKGYEISLTFLWLSDPRLAVKRVAQRVRQGGHNVPEETIVRRYYLGVKNILLHYLPLVDKALIVDNSIEESQRKLIARKNIDGSMDILDKIIWEKMERAAHERRP